MNTQETAQCNAMKDEIQKILQGHMSNRQLELVMPKISQLLEKHKNATEWLISGLELIEEQSDQTFERVIATDAIDNYNKALQ
jgi:hypothetical protein